MLPQQSAFAPRYRNEYGLAARKAIICERGELRHVGALITIEEGQVAKGAALTSGFWNRVAMRRLPCRHAPTAFPMAPIL